MSADHAGRAARTPISPSLAVAGAGDGPEPRRELRGPPAGWRVIAAKELARPPPRASGSSCC